MEKMFIAGIDVTDVVEKIRKKTNKFSQETSIVSKKGTIIEIVILNRSKRNDFIRISKFKNLIVVENKTFIERFIPPMQKENVQFVEFYKIPSDQIVKEENLIIVFNKFRNRELVLCRNSQKIICEFSDDTDENYICFCKNGNSKLIFDKSIEEAVESWTKPDNECSLTEFLKSLKRAKFAYFKNPNLNSLKMLRNLKELATTRKVAS